MGIVGRINGTVRRALGGRKRKSGTRGSAKGKAKHEIKKL